MNSDVNLYEESTDSYDKLQNLRPDYTGAKNSLLDLAFKYTGGVKTVSLADFCCGTGINTKMLAEKLSISYSILIDINKKFIEIAKSSNIKTKIKTVVSDILKAKLPFFTQKVDIVVSMFAYHHITDEHKYIYIKKIAEFLKKDGLLLLGEIYLPNKELTLEYYKKVYNSIENKSPELERFLMETASSNNFEYKVPKEFADKQLISANFTLLESRKIYPTDNSFDKDVGTFVEVWKFNG